MRRTKTPRRKSKSIICGLENGYYRKDDDGVVPVVGLGLIWVKRKIVLLI